MSTKYEKTRDRLVKKIVAAKKRAENAKYGELIVQSNEIQLILGLAVLQRASLPDEDYVNHLEKAGLGKLIGLFQTCACRNIKMWQFIKALQKYKSERDRVAHKMFSKKKLTPAECEAAIALGVEILKILYRLTKIKTRLKGKSN